MIDYFRKLEIINSNYRASDKMFQCANDNRIKINSVIDTLTNEQKEIIINKIKETVNRINPEIISITKLEKTMSAYLFVIQFDLPTKNLNPITFLIRRGIFWELFGYKYKYKIQILKLTVQLNNLKQEVKHE